MMQVLPWPLRCTRFSSCMYGSLQGLERKRSLLDSLVSTGICTIEILSDDKYIRRLGPSILFGQTYRDFVS